MPSFLAAVFLYDGRLTDALGSHRFAEASDF
jgi:hypothetical protein